MHACMHVCVGGLLAFDCFMLVWTLFTTQVRNEAERIHTVDIRCDITFLSLNISTITGVIV